ncbi:hypothetical protein SLS58_002610 [Diplodia intermedia]|uniref:Uncharacterized protein n=1 Tax=Diplodia intermedia TaxID=856260 RepID=A0ABR3TZW1_9PEZI
MIRQDGADVEVELLETVVELARFEELTDGVTDDVVTVLAEVSAVLEPVEEDKDVEVLVPKEEYEEDVEEDVEALEAVEEDMDVEALVLKEKDEEDVEALEPVEEDKDVEALVPQKEDEEDVEALVPKEKELPVLLDVEDIPLLELDVLELAVVIVEVGLATQ